jgi:hypothetical protein
LYKADYYSQTDNHFREQIWVVDVHVCKNV